MSSIDIHKHLICCTLTINSTTLYTYENQQLTSHLNKLNCSEIISQELGLINSSKTLVGSIPVSTNTSLKLSLYFMKKFLNIDGSRDLITVVAIAHVDVNKTFILIVLRNIMDKYIEFKMRQEDNKSDRTQKSKPGEFKLFMNQIIKYEEMNYNSNEQVYGYGSTNGNDNEADAEASGNNNSNNNTGLINANQLLLANEEVGEVRQLMLENINKLLKRGDKINSLVDQTDRLNTSSSLFQKKAQQIKRKMWFHKTKFIASITGGAMIVVYLLIGSECGYPLFDSCRS
ncbi:hypothetical protein KGF56_004797 [Candida oxycetoniae]|uniref:V-SNARE coiled-coil homology domain-containing protein n=1 Tax=Candida oxycetoniae TaxID=497107 RepID=A0AAI9WVJ6_9ASCO|nr:uncharacterized protein KGF56_004797 [Candida oxycetoniae]KAI3402389.2 hypothetical protein KGF56_004797 [Candida oxycetoniae]